MKYLILSALFFVFLGWSVWAADSSDSLFDHPDPDTPADTSQTVSLDAFTGQSLRFFETLDVSGYFVGGYKESGDFVTTPVNALSFGFGSDVRLDRTARAYASFSLRYPKPGDPSTDLYNPAQPPVSTAVPTDLVFTSIDVKELFLDYSLGTVAIVRLGRQTATWGQGRIFNPGNFVTGIGNGMAIKVSTALGPVALTSALIKNDGLYYGGANAKNSFALQSIGTSTLAEYTSEWFTAGVSGFYHHNVGEKADFYVKSSLFGADLFGEVVGEWGYYGQTSYTGMAGLYREFGDKSKWLKLQAEWLVSGRGNKGSFAKVSEENLGFLDQTVGLAGTSDLLAFMETKPSAMWLHSLKDNSGQIILGFVNSSLPHIDLTLGFTRAYGAKTGRYIVNNPDPEDRTLALTLKAAFKFDIKS